MSSFSIIIPARLASTRFPRKVLHNIHGLPMIEHVRRRGLLVEGVDQVVVATCDKEIVSLIKHFSGEVILTSQSHINGTHRIAEAARKIKSNHIILLQGDEPCVEPDTITSFIDFIKKNKANFFNIVSPITNKKMLYDTSTVKCSLDNNFIKNCFRKSPYIADYEKQKKYVYKMLGIMSFERNFLLNIKNLTASIFSKNESIEQLQLIDNKVDMKGFIIERDYPSINNVSDLNLMEKEFRKIKQKKLLSLILRD